MLIHVPGAQPVLNTLRGGQDSGFGSSGDQVLLNGKRFGGKGQVLNALRRIQSAKVQWIELIPGNLGDTNVLSEGLVINVVLVEEASTGAGSWQANARFNDRGRVDGDGLVSYSDGLGALDYNVGIERKVRSSGGRPNPIQKTRIETYFYPSGVVRESRPQEFWLSTQQYSATANLTYNFESGDRLRLNGLFNPRLDTDDVDIALSRFDPSGAPLLTAAEQQQTRRGWDTQWEIGGDYETLLGDTARLNVLFIHAFENNPVSSFRNLTQRACADRT